jgi:PAS domain S-box-containing protein
MELTRLAPRGPRDPDAPAGREELFATVFNSAPNGITVVDAAGRYVNANASFVRLVGYGEEELRGKTLFDLAHADDVAASWRAFEAVVTGEADRLELDQRYLRKDGAVLWVHLSVARIADAEGRVTHVVVQVEDLSARRAAEQRLRESERRFRMLVEGVTDYAIYMLSPQGEVASWNPGAERIKGYRADEVLGKPFALFFTAEDRAAGLPARALETARATGRFHAEGWRLRKDGSRFWALAVLDAVYDESGQLAGFAKVTRDITERREAAQRLADSEARLHAFTDNSPALMCLKDRDGRYRFANARFLERHALSLEQLVGRTDGELFPRAQALALAAHDAEVIARGRPVEFEQTVQVGGDTRVQLVLKFPAAGGVGIVMTDITDRRLTEQALREQRLMLAEAQKVAGLGSWEWDPDSGRLLWSAELYRIHGLTPDAFQPTFESYLERVHPEDRQHSGAMMARALMDGRGFTMHQRIVRPGGEVRYLRSHAEVVRGERGRPVKILGACLDVTDQRHSETALRQAAQDLHALTRKLVAAEEAERRRIAGELHDRVGQSLSALNINLDIVLRDAGLAPAVRQRLEDSVALVDATLQSIEGVMAELRPALLDEYGLAAALGWHAEEVARRSGLRVAVEEAADASQGLRLEAALALFRIAQEALNNAVKHAQASSVTIRVCREDGHALLEVRDDGRGFDPSSTRKGRWGMTTMRERAEAAGGRLEVDAGPGKGTCVRARVPTQ